MRRRRDNDEEKEGDDEEEKVEGGGRGRGGRFQRSEEILTSSLRCLRSFNATRRYGPPRCAVYGLSMQ